MESQEPGFDSDEEAFDIPQWQKDEVLRRKRERELDPSLLIPQEEAEARLRSRVRRTDLAKLPEDVAGPNEEPIDIPQWQQEEVLRRLAAYDADPSIGISWDEAVKRIGRKGFE